MGGPPGSPEEDGDRYIEIWNLVFMQFDRDAAGTLNPLPKPSIDTGMGLERVAAVMQGVHSNYEIDLFQNLLAAAAQRTGHADTRHPSLRVIADHIRSCAFLITDGVLPSNEGRGYVLRRIIRRAIRHGHKLGAQGNFFHRLVGALDAEMGDAYPELRQARHQIERVLLKEEEQFARTLEHGMGLLEEALAGLDGEVLPGETVFKLYDTYGFPYDLTADVCRERDVVLDEIGFERALEAQRERARAASQFGADYGAALELEGETTFTGYDRLDDRATVTALIDREGNALARLATEQRGLVVLDRTPFYAESGGQVGDTGYLHLDDGSRFLVTDTQKQGDHHLHHGVLLEGELAVGAAVRPEVNGELRGATVRNHSATHLMHKALRLVLGEHVQQKGSLVTPERLRFDFSHFEAMTPEQLAEVERLVNEQILANAPTLIETMTLDQAKAKGAAALFEAKYADSVRVLTIGADDFSIELCGGTHVARSGDIGCFHIVSEQGIASGVRRIEAITGEGALTYFREQEARLSRIGERLKAKPEQVEERVDSLVERNRSLEKELERLKAKLASAAGSDMLAEAREIAGVKVLATRLEGVSGKELRGVLDQLKNKLGSGIVVLGVADAEAGKVSLIAGVTQDLTGRVKAGELVNHVASQVGGKGGGRPDMAQAGGSDVAALPGALESVPPGWRRASSNSRSAGPVTAGSRPCQHGSTFHSSERLRLSTHEGNTAYGTIRTEVRRHLGGLRGAHQGRGREGQGLSRTGPPGRRGGLRHERRDQPPDRHGQRDQRRADAAGAGHAGLHRRAGDHLAAGHGAAQAGRGRHLLHRLPGGHSDRQRPHQGAYPAHRDR